MKNKIRTKSIICIVLISILFILTANVYASTDSFKTSLNANHSTLKRGEEVIVTISLSDIAIESGYKGIGAYTARIDFDSSVLEYVETNGTDKWEAPLYQDALLVGNSGDGEVAKNAENIGTITFKVKEDAKLGETTIKLTNFVGATGERDGEGDVVAEDSTITITIIAQDEQNQGGSGSQSGNEGQGGSGSQSGNEGQGGSGSQGGNEGQGGSGNQGGNASQGGNTTGNVNGNGDNQNSGTNSNKPNSSNTNKEDIKPGTLPQTGNSNVAIFLSIGVLLTLAIICLIRIRLLKNKR